MWPKREFQEVGVLGTLIGVVGLGLVLAGCYDMSEYSGDGELIDNGIFSATDRYVLSLGVVELDRPVTRTFRMESLPEESFVVGIEISVVSENRHAIENREINPVVALELRDTKGSIVLSKKAQLADWTWSIPVNESRAFVYGRGDPETYFEPVSETAYILTFSVARADSTGIEYEAGLLAKSGGWK